MGAAYQQIERMDNRGRYYCYWVPLMPGIPPPFLHSVAYLYGSVADAEAGERSGGTGFVLGVHESGFGYPFGAVSSIYDVPPWRGVHHLYVVTAKHVVRNPKGTAPVVRLTSVTREGFGYRIAEPRILDMPEEAWWPHPDGDDIAVCPIGPSTLHPDVAFIPTTFLLPAHDPDHYAAPGDETFFVGRFVTHDGKQRNTPTVRFGNISMLPSEPVEMPSGIRQEAYLVEMRSLPGYSGSPVFVYHGENDKSGQLKGYDPMARAFLIGVDVAHLGQHMPLLDKDGVTLPQGHFVKGNSGMMVVVPAHKLRELLEEEELEDMRKDTKAKLEKAAEGAAELDSLTPEDYTKNEFMRDLKRAAQRRPPSSEPPSTEER